MLPSILNIYDIYIRPVFFWASEIEWYYVGALLVVSIVGFFLYRSLLENRHFRELFTGFLKIQKSAFDNIMPGGKSAMSLPTEKFRGRHFARTSNGLSIAYTITKENSAFTHLISGKAQRKPQKFLIQCMLLIMAQLTQQFERSGFGEEVKFNIAESGLGTHFIEFMLNSKQQETLRAISDSTNF